MITKRDQDILNFIEDFRIVTSNQIHSLFFSDISYRYSRKRLKYLFDEGHIKRTRSTISNDYAYYIDKKPMQVHHDLIRSELYANLKNRYNLLEWNNEVTISGIRPDALAYVNNHGIVFPLLIEIHLNNKFDFDKYQRFVNNNNLKALFGIAPRVVICTDRQITIPQSIGIAFKLIGIDMNGLDSLFKTALIKANKFTEGMG